MRRSLHILILFGAALSCSSHTVVDGNAPAADAGATGGAAGSTSGGSAGATTGGSAGISGNAGQSSGGGGSGGAAGAISITVDIANNDDDVMWAWTPASGWDELAQAASNNDVLRIRDVPGVRIESVGLRFQLPVPADATLVSASLRATLLLTPADSMQSSDTLELRMFEPDVPFAPGDAGHKHSPSDHGTLANAAHEVNVPQLTNLDVTSLVAPRLTSASGWQAGSFVGFHLAAKNADSRVLRLGDKGNSAYPGASLAVTYVP